MFFIPKSYHFGPLFIESNKIIFVRPQLLSKSWKKVGFVSNFFSLYLNTHFALSMTWQTSSSSLDKWDRSYRALAWNISFSRCCWFRHLAKVRNKEAFVVFSVSFLKLRLAVLNKEWKNTNFRLIASVSNCFWIAHGLLLKRDRSD